MARMAILVSARSLEIEIVAHEKSHSQGFMDQYAAAMQCKAVCKDDVSEKEMFISEIS
jgi:hypothetical protein